MGTLLLIVKSMRLRQWVKNVFVLMPIVFGGKLFHLPILFNVIQAFFIFCLASSAFYIINDIKDERRDAFHPLKRIRPIASGELKKSTALAISFVLAIASFAWAFYLNISLFILILVYALTHLLYTFKFKREVILDVVIIALGFELRVWGGGVTAGALPSIWLQLCVFLLALFLALIKRRQEKISLYRDAAKHRDVLSRYKIYFLDQIIMISAALCIVFYGLYTVSPDITSRIGSNHMAYTIPFVIYGIFRYLYVVHAKKTCGDPTEIVLTDPALIIDMVLWLIVSAYLIYGSF